MLGRWIAASGSGYRLIDLFQLFAELIDQHADHYHWDTGKSWTASRDAVGKADELGGGHSHCGGMIHKIAMSLSSFTAMVPVEVAMLPLVIVLLSSEMGSVALTLLVAVLPLRRLHQAAISKMSNSLFTKRTSSLTCGLQVMQCPRRIIRITSNPFIVAAAVFMV